MSTLSTVSGEARHAIGVAESVSRGRTFATRVVAMAVRAIFVTAALALSLLSFGLGTPNAQAVDQTSLDAQVKQSLVYIGMESVGFVDFPPGVLDANTLASIGMIDPNYSDQGVSEYHWIKAKTGGTCSGIIVDPAGYIATAGHCVGGDPQDDKAEFYEAAINAVFPGLAQHDPATFQNAVNTAINGEWKIEGQQPGSAPVIKVVVIQPQMEGRVITQAVTADVVDFQKAGDGDNALLKVSNLPPLPASPVADHVPPPGTAITSVGFPGAVGEILDPNSLQEPSFKDGTVSSTQIQPSGASTTEVSTAISPGMSGGPTVNNATGEVMGLNDMTVSNEQGTAAVAGTNFITDAAGLHAFLVKNSVHLVALPVPAKPFPWIWIAVGGTVVALVLLALPTVLVLRHRAKRRSVPRIDGSQLLQPAPSAQPAPEQSVGSPQPLPAYQQSPTGASEPLGRERSDVPATVLPPLTLSTNGAVEIK
jgi:serine protease Do